MDNMKLTLDIIKTIYHNLIQSTDGFEGIKDDDQIERLINDSIEYENTIDLASYYLYSVINRRPFIDKNKAMALLLFELVLRDSGIEIEFTDKELYNLIRDVQDNSMSIQEISKYVQKKEELV